MAEERTGVVTFKGGPVTLLGPDVKVGDKAPDYTLVNNGMQPVTLASTAGKTRIICTVPSVDTPVCAIETKKFNDQAAGLGDNVVVQIVSLDMPFAQKRFCGAEGTDKIQTLSDFKDHNFCHNWGVQIKELGIMTRAIFVVGPDDKVKHVEWVKEVAEEPNYDAAIAAAKG